MRRAAAIAVTLVSLWGGASAHAQEPGLAVKLSACETGLDPADRYAVFTGSMPRQGAPVMAMRFDLQQRLPGERWAKVTVDGWGEWIRATKKGVPGFIYTRRLEQLAAPAHYRTIVTFRWSETDGHVIRTLKRYSRSCRQPDWRPDLHVRRVTLDDASGTADVVVENRGRGDAGAFAVHATRGDLVKGRTLGGLDAGAVTTVTLKVGRCAPGETVTVTADPAGAVDEADEGDNVLAVACPV